MKLDTAQRERIQGVLLVFGALASFFFGILLLLAPSPVSSFGVTGW